MKMNEPVYDEPIFNEPLYAEVNQPQSEDQAEISTVRNMSYRNPRENRVTHDVQLTDNSTTQETDVDINNLSECPAYFIHA